MNEILAGHTPSAHTIDYLAGLEPTAADLAAIEAEMPAVLADLERLDEQLRAANPAARRTETLDERRVRRARKQLAARRIAQINVVARRTAVEQRTDGAA